MVLTVPIDRLLGFGKVCPHEASVFTGLPGLQPHPEAGKLVQRTGEAPILPCNKVGARVWLPPLSEAAEVPQLSEARRDPVFNKYHPTAGSEISQPGATSSGRFCSYVIKDQ